MLFDAVAIVAGAAAIGELVAQPAAINWVADAFVHCKVIAAVGDARPLLDAARVVAGDGVVSLAGDAAVAQFIKAAKRGRVWSREAPAGGRCGTTRPAGQALTTCRPERRCCSSPGSSDSRCRRCGSGRMPGNATWAIAA